MAIQRKKIIVLICGDYPDFADKNWQRNVPELSLMAEVEPIIVFDKPGSTISPSAWEKLADAIYKHYNEAAGFVVLHDLDNLLFTASALSFQLQKLSKPIIFTGTSSRQSLKASEVRANLINAIQAVNTDVPEVSIMFGNRLIRANTSVVSNEHSLNLFTSPNQSIIGRVYFSIRVFENTKNTKKAKPTQFKLESNVYTRKVSPLMGDIDSIKKAAAIVIDASTYKQVPSELIKELNKKTDGSIVVWLPKSNESVKGCTVASNMTWETTVTKTMWALEQTKSKTEFQKLMAKNIAGELLK